ncbi:MAG TPA: diguanylate cyclase [Mariprofundaceae bacterium]|nr:diguanylate cyclase [Mariprofundaceae bacterium]
MTTSLPADDPGTKPPARPYLKWGILAPFTIVLVLVIALFSYFSYRHQQEDLDLEASRLSSSIQYLYQKGLIDHAEVLAAAIDGIVHDERLQDAMIHHDRQRLLELSQAKFAELKAKYGITHWYFTGTDRINLLRVHQPSRFGDKIDRYTMLEAARTGAPSHGIEIGPLGTFTLRYVYPWYVQQNGASRLIGYVELGMEVEHLFDEIENMMDIGISVFIEKSLLNRKLWEEGVEMLGRVPNWDRFPTLVSSAFRNDRIAAPLLDQIVAEDHRIEFGPQDLSSGKLDYWVVPVSLEDVRHQHVGYAVAFMDVTAKTLAARQQLAAVIAFATLAGVLLFAGFYRLLNSTEKRLVAADAQLRNLATHDGLTGLLNHRVFQTRLAQETERTRRYGKPLSMLMIDLDRFKDVNDTHGHDIGDYVLQRVSELIMAQCRSIDTVCRYGGEEIAVLLPETPLAEAMHAAERIRMHIESDDFAGSGVPGLRITTSIGISAIPSHADNPSTLVKSADHALYAAKEAGRNRVVAAEPLPK